MQTRTSRQSLPTLAAIALSLALGPLVFSESVEVDELADRDIADAIENEFLFETVIDLNRVDVDVNEGIAELTGTVGHLLAKDRATEIAERVKGVRSVSNRLQVDSPLARTDSDIRGDVVQALLRDPATDAYELEVAVADGVVTLTGQVESWAEKQLSATVVKGVSGVAEVRNDISIDFDTDHRPDSEIAPEIEKRLRWDVWVDDGLIDVAVEDGHVTLTGTVGSAAERRRAATNAWVSGVRSVDDTGLNVEWWAKDTELRDLKYTSVSDDAVASAIRDAALYDPRVASFNIETDVRNGWVTLRGTVDNLRAKQAAEVLAQNTVGVVGVTNRLKVRVMGTRSDAAIAAEIEDALLDNPTTDAYEIAVAVTDGRVTLSGTVNGNYEKALAESIASGVRGVTDVYNLVITPSESPTRDYPWSWTDSWVSIPPTDAHIREQIKDQYFWSPYVDADDVTVEVSGAVATLRGSVDSWLEYRAAAENALEGGAHSVVNRLSVEPGKR